MSVDESTQASDSFELKMTPDPEDLAATTSPVERIAALVSEDEEA